MHPPIAAALAVPLLAVALAAGCAGLPAADRPSRLPTEPAGSGSTIASPAASVSPATPPVPSPSTEAQRVEQAVRDYYAAANTAFATGDVSALLARSTDDCNCRFLATNIQQAAKKGKITGGLIAVHSVQVVDVQYRVASVWATFSSANGVVLDGRGQVVERFVGIPKGGDSFGLVQLQSGEWLVDDEQQSGQRSSE